MITDLIAKINALKGKRKQRVTKVLNLIEPLITEALHSDRRIMVSRQSMDSEVVTPAEVTRAQEPVTLTESISKYGTLELHYTLQHPVVRDVDNVAGLLIRLHNAEGLAETLLGLKVKLESQLSHYGNKASVVIRLKKVKTKREPQTLPDTVPSLVRYIMNQQGDHATRVTMANTLIAKMVIQTTTAQSEFDQGLGVIGRPDRTKYWSLIQELTSSRKLNLVLERYLQVRLHVLITIDGHLLNGCVKLKPI